jgi:hypothetical protein
LFWSACLFNSSHWLVCSSIFSVSVFSTTLISFNIFLKNFESIFILTMYNLFVRIKFFFLLICIYLNLIKYRFDSFLFYFTLSDYSLLNFVYYMIINNSSLIFCAKAYFLEFDLTHISCDNRFFSLKFCSILEVESFILDIHWNLIVSVKNFILNFAGIILNLNCPNSFILYIFWRIILLSF